MSRPLNICRAQPSADRNSKDHVEHSTPIESGDHGDLITKTSENVDAGEGCELNRGGGRREIHRQSLSFVHEHRNVTVIDMRHRVTCNGRLKVERMTIFHRCTVCIGDKRGCHFFSRVSPSVLSGPFLLVISTWTVGVQFGRRVRVDETEIVCSSGMWARRWARIGN